MTRWAYIGCALSLLTACGKASQHDGSMGAQTLGSTATTSASGTTGGATDLILCDGTDRLRFSVVIPASNVITDQWVLWENGGRFLFVDGHCRFWVSGPDNPSQLERYHSGVLSDLDRSALEGSFFWGRWAEKGLLGSWAKGQGQFDFASKVFQSPEGQVGCDSGCGAESNPVEILQMRNAEQVQVERLWQAGAPYDSSLRIQVNLYATAGLVPNAIWPLSWSLAEVVHTPEDASEAEPGSGILIDDPEEVAALREIWDDYDSIMPETWKTYGIPFEDPQVPGVVFSVFVRDTLPFEEANGLVTLPW